MLAYLALRLWDQLAPGEVIATAVVPMQSKRDLFSDMDMDVSFVNRALHTFAHVCVEACLHVPNSH